MSQNNSAIPFGNINQQNLQQSLGIPQFPGALGTDWFLVTNGLIYQGGIITLPGAPTVFPFNTAFTKQVLAVIIQSKVIGMTPGVTVTTLADFTVNHGGASHEAYWWAIGV